MRFTSLALCFLVLATLLHVSDVAPVAAQDAAGPSLDIPMDRDLTTVVIHFGLNDREPTSWEGSYRLTDGRIVAADGWRFVADDYATLSKFKLGTRRFYPRFWGRRGGSDPTKLAIEPNGVVLTFANIGPSTMLEVSTSSGDFKVPVGKLTLAAPQRALAGNVTFQRVPTSRQVVQAPTEDGYPSALATTDGRLCVAYLAFTHGEGCESPLKIPTEPEDFSFLKKPTGGDQLMFTEFDADADRWSAPVGLTETGSDLFDVAMAEDGQGRLWVIWSANVNDNWDLYAKFQSGGRWSDTIRVTSAPGADFRHAATTDSQGRVWLAWQGFGRTSSDILVAQQSDDSFGPPTTLAASEANEWAPTIAASPDGRVAVAWDTYERGSYDVSLKQWRQGKWGTERLVAGTLANEARASVAFDPQNRLWIAYEISPEGWGKDFGPYDMSPKKTALYKQRNLGVKVLEGQTLRSPETDVSFAMPGPAGKTRSAKNTAPVLASSPQLAVDAVGRVWLAARIRLSRFSTPVGGTWVSYLTTLDADGWRPAVIVPETDGFLHESPSLVPAPDSGLYVVAASDGRFRGAASFGPIPGKGRKRSATAPPARTRNYVEYPDKAFNKEITVADTGPMARPAGSYKLVEVEPDTPAGPSGEARREAENIAAMQAYRTEVKGTPLRIVRGEFHRHTELSGDGAGDGSIFDMWRYALDMAAMDWLGNGDHDNGGNREFTWWFTQKTTSIFNMPGTFTSMYTYERSCGYPDGHRNAVFTERGIRPLARLQNGRGKAMDALPDDAVRPNTPDTQMFYKYLRFFDGVCASHTSGTDMGTDWRDNDPKVEPIVEIYQGDRNNYERPGAPRSNSAEYSLGGWRPLGFVSRALLKGYRLGFQSSSDHISTHMSYCNVWVEEPTREAILDGMKRRRVYGATDNIIADVRSGEHFMGEEFTVDKPPVIDVKLIGTAPFEEVVIVKDNEYVYSTRPNKQTVEFRWTDITAKPGTTSYYYVRGTQVGQTERRRVKSPANQPIEKEFNNGEIVWVSPMWITYEP